MTGTAAHFVHVGETYVYQGKGLTVSSMQREGDIWVVTGQLEGQAAPVRVESDGMAIFPLQWRP